MRRDLSSNAQLDGSDRPARRTRRRAAAVGFVALLALHTGLRAEPGTEDLIRGIPDELALRVVWMTFAWAFLLWLSGGIWNSDPSARESGAGE